MGGIIAATVSYTHLDVYKRQAMAIPLAIGNEVFITYIGLGLPVSTPSLGNLINQGRMIMMNPSLPVSYTHLRVLPCRNKKTCRRA